MATITGPSGFNSPPPRAQDQNVFGARVGTLRSAYDQVVAGRGGQHLAYNNPELVNLYSTNLGVNQAQAGEMARQVSDWHKAHPGQVISQADQTAMLWGLYNQPYGGAPTAPPAQQVQPTPSYTPPQQYNPPTQPTPAQTAPQQPVATQPSTFYPGPTGPAGSDYGPYPGYNRYGGYRGYSRGAQQYQQGYGYGSGRGYNPYGGGGYYPGYASGDAGFFNVGGTGQRGPGLTADKPPAAPVDYYGQLQSMVNRYYPQQGSATVPNQDINAYANAMPNPNQIVPTNWYRLPTSSRDFLLGTYERMGWSPQDVEETIARQRTAWQAPWAGGIAR
jgi:hypothetical protein